jgi:hypothetical protein
MIQNICHLTVVHQYLEMLPGEAFSIERLSVLDLMSEQDKVFQDP